MKSASLALTAVVALALMGQAACKREPAARHDEPAPGQLEVGKAAAGGPRTPRRSDIRIVVITHGQASDPFWSVVKHGVDQAASDMAVKVEYQSPTSFDMVAMSRLIDAAVASKPHGLAVSVPDPGALRTSISNATKAGIPVVSLNSGADVAQELGVLAHVGQTEYEAGLGGGARMAAAGVTKALCVNHEVGNVSQDLRCKGFTDGITNAGGSVDILAVDLADPTESAQRISAALAADSAINGVFTLGPAGVAPALRALSRQALLDKVELATLDLSPQVLEAIRDGKMLFAIDQQQYLQGYLPVVLLTLYKTNLNTIADQVLRTGPGFVTRDTAARVIELSRQGTR